MISDFKSSLLVPPLSRGSCIDRDRVKRCRHLIVAVVFVVVSDLIFAHTLPVNDKSEPTFCVIWLSVDY